MEVSESSKSVVRKWIFKKEVDFSGVEVERKRHGSGAEVAGWVTGQI